MADLTKPKIRARYAVKGPKKEKVSFTAASIDENGALQLEQKEEERDCYMVFFPHGHSIRVTSFDELKRMGFHLKPRMVDMNTGDVVDVGGDPYDFANNPQDFEPVLVGPEDEDDLPQRSRPKKD